ncbi:MAG: hypothetical protein WC890_04555 [Candidatus Margulisiibacteriota bacterium]
MTSVFCYNRDEVNCLFKKSLVYIIFAAFFIQNAFAFYGTRPMGMGSAFTAVANDANAAYWNPAGLALNPEVVVSGSTMLNNRNQWVGDNVLYSKFCYEMEMSPFEWVAGVGIASLLALESAQYLHEQGILKTGWNNDVPATSRDQSMASQVKGTEEVVSLKKTAKDAIKKVFTGDKAPSPTPSPTPPPSPVYVTPASYYLAPFGNPWYRPYRPDYEPYWAPQPKHHETKAQFALGLGWMNDYNPPLDQNSNWYTLSVASGFEQRVAVGGNINVYNLKKISTDISGLGGDIDLGVIAKPVEYISLGLVTKGILTTNIYWQDGSQTRYEMLVNAGIAIQPTTFLTLAADAHNLFRTATTYHYGIEANVLPGLIGRAGLSDGSKTCGLSIVVGRITVDWAYLGGSYNRTHMVGANIQL